jgi:hypothetical protein
MDPNVTPQTQKFVGLFNGIDKAEIIPWTDVNYVGLSIMKDYPEKGLFIPAKNKKGKQDTVALIKIGYLPTNPPSPDNKVLLNVSIHKVSRYLSGRLGYNFDDEESPTKISLQQSKESRQPFDLEEESRYEYYLDSNKFRDLKTKRYVKPKKIVVDIYSTHLKTLKNVKFRLEVAIQKKISDSIDPSLKFLRNVNLILFGKRIKETDNFGVGIFEIYSHNNLIDMTLEKDKIRILGSDLPISYHTARTFIIFVLGLFLINYYFHFDFLGFVALTNVSAKNSLFLAALVAALLIIFDRVIPHGIITLMNTLIRLRLHLITRKINF